MGLFDFLKKKQNSKTEQEPPIPASEKIYYHPDGYYTDYSYPGTYMARKVITFEERKKTSYPSKTGLYVAEILLLEYCSYGTYPHPKNGYPGIWWFEYGIRNVGAKLDSLRERGYIEYCSATETLYSFTVAQLKELAAAQNIHVSGKKDAIIDQIKASIPADILDSIVTDRKYKLTPKGMTELQENAYVPYMHKHHEKTTDDTRFGPAFNVWTINQKINSNPTLHWSDLVAINKAEVAADRADRAAKTKSLIESSKDTNPTFYKEMKRMERKLEEQDKQLNAIKNAEQDFKDTGDIETLIEFWESIWGNGGLLFNSSTWAFRLPDLYMKVERYNDALKILHKIKDTSYSEKKQSYIDKCNKA